MTLSFRTLFLVLAATFAFSFSTQAQNKELSSGSIAFKAAEKKDVKAETKEFTSTINLVDKTIAFSVPVDGFEFKMGMMQKHFIDEGVMNTANFPNATFVGNIIADTDLTQDGMHDVRAEGVMTLVETSLQFNVNGIIETANGVPTLKANFMVNGHEYGIDSKKVEKFSDQVEVRVEATYQ